MTHALVDKRRKEIVQEAGFRRRIKVSNELVLTEWGKAVILLLIMSPFGRFQALRIHRCRSAPPHIFLSIEQHMEGCFAFSFPLRADLSIVASVDSLVGAPSQQKMMSGTKVSCRWASAHLRSPFDLTVCARLQHGFGSPEIHHQQAGSPKQPEPRHSRVWENGVPLSC